MRKLQRYWPLARLYYGFLGRIVDPKKRMQLHDAITRLGDFNGTPEEAVLQMADALAPGDPGYQEVRDTLRQIERQGDMPLLLEWLSLKTVRLRYMVNKAGFSPAGFVKFAYAQALLWEKEGKRQTTFFFEGELAKPISAAGAPFEMSGVEEIKAASLRLDSFGFVEHILGLSMPKGYSVRQDSVVINLLRNSWAQPEEAVQAAVSEQDETLAALEGGISDNVESEPFRKFIDGHRTPEMSPEQWQAARNAGARYAMDAEHGGYDRRMEPYSYKHLRASTDSWGSCGKGTGTGRRNGLPRPGARQRAIILYDYRRHAIQVVTTTSIPPHKIPFNPDNSRRLGAGKLPRNLAFKAKKTKTELRPLCSEQVQPKTKSNSLRYTIIGTIAALLSGGTAVLRSSQNNLDTRVSKPAAADDFIAQARRDAESKSRSRKAGYSVEAKRYPPVLFNGSQVVTITGGHATRTLADEVEGICRAQVAANPEQWVFFVEGWDYFQGYPADGISPELAIADAVTQNAIFPLKRCPYNLGPCGV